MTATLTRSVDIEGTDMFSGFGGATSGAHRVPGVRMVQAINHWKLAVDAHQANHPDTEHDCADLSQVKPSRYRRTPLLWASPECTWHANAAGRRSDEDLFTAEDDRGSRSRATMWDVVRFAEFHQYDVIIVENVVEARAKWRPWPAWVQALELIGYEVKVVYLNSMHAAAGGPAAPQSRDRLYVVCWIKGAKAPDLAKWTRPTATCTACGHTGRAMQGWKDATRQHGRYGANGQYWWRCPTPRCHAIVHPVVLGAGSILDLSQPSERVGDPRPKPYVEGTLARMRKGIDRHREHLAIGDWLVDDYNGPARLLSAPLPTLTTVEGDALYTVADDVLDSLRRMFTDRERLAGMGITEDYVLLGTAKQRHRMIGNAVTPPSARDLVFAAAESLTGRDLAGEQRWRGGEAR